MLAQPQEQKGAFTSTHKHHEKNFSDIECFNCHKKGHYSSNCPHNAMLCVECRMDYRGSLPALERKAVTKPGVLKRGIVKGKLSQEILLDTGCSRTLMHQDLVLEEKIIEGEAVVICAHGDMALYPLAQITMEVDGNIIEVEAAVLSTLPMGVLLGTDTEELAELLAEDRAEEVAYAVTTRAAQKKVKEEAQKSLEKEQAL